MSCGTAVLLVVKVQGTFRAPKYLDTTSVSAEVQNACAEGYSGWFTVNSGVQVGSGSVSGFPSVSARGIAVRGLQKRKKYFALKPAINASADAVCTRANRRAVSRMFHRELTAKVIRLRFQPAYACSDQK